MPDDWDSGPGSVTFNRRMRQVEDQDGVKAGDLWRHSDSGTLRVLAIDGDTAFCAENLESRKPTHRLEPTFHFRTYFCLLERDGKDGKVKRPDPKPEAKARKLEEQISRLKALLEECLDHLSPEVQRAVKRKMLAIEVLASDDPLVTFGKKLHEAHQRRKK